VQKNSKAPKTAHTHTKIAKTLLFKMGAVKTAERAAPPQEGCSAGFFLLFATQKMSIFATADEQFHGIPTFSSLNLEKMRETEEKRRRTSLSWNSSPHFGQNFKLVKNVRSLMEWKGWETLYWAGTNHVTVRNITFFVLVTKRISLSCF